MDTLRRNDQGADGRYTIKRGGYRQSFELSCKGLVSTVPPVRP